MAESTIDNSINTITAEGPEIVIAGTTYALRRLGIGDLFKVAYIIRDVYRKGAEELVFSSRHMDAKEAVSFIIALGFTHVEDKVLKFFSYLLDVSFEDIQNPVKFPMSSFVQIGMALSNHPDVLSFFVALRESGISTETLLGAQVAAEPDQTIG